MNKIYSVLFIISAWALIVHADTNDDFIKMKETALKEFDEFKNKSVAEFESFRRRANEEFAKKMTEPWQPTELSPQEKPPVSPPPSPVIVDMDTISIKFPTPIVISEITPLPVPTPQPQPIDPIQPIDDEIGITYFTINMYGTDFRLRKPDMSGFKLSSNSRQDISNGWKWLNRDHTNNLINDCLSLREDKALCDWAYLSLLQRVATSLTGGDINATTLLTGFLFSQSGYKMRFAMDKRGNLNIFYNPTGIVFNTNLLMIDGERYYRLDNGLLSSDSYELCKFSFPGEKPLSFEILRPMKLDYKPASARRVVAHSYLDMVAEISVNSNLIDFYNSYPEASVTTKPVTLWAVYANTPASPEVENSLYPSIRKAVSGKSQYDAVNMLLNLAQTFPYGYDDEIWGRDRAFFMDESWFYPNSDCEDHSINFARMVRDILGLDVALLYYPGHMATAVVFTEDNVNGDYIIYEGKKYIVCDPTIFYAKTGITMDGMDNTEAVFIPLR